MDEWELGLCSDQVIQCVSRHPCLSLDNNFNTHLSLVQPVTLTTEEGGPRMTDSYCYEMLSMVMALSGSSVGRLYLAQQYGLLKVDLLCSLLAPSGGQGVLISVCLFDFLSEKKMVRLVVIKAI